MAEIGRLRKRSSFRCEIKENRQNKIRCFPLLSFSFGGLPPKEIRARGGSPAECRGSASAVPGGGAPGQKMAGNTRACRKTGHTPCARTPCSEKRLEISGHQRIEHDGRRIQQAIQLITQLVDLCSSLRAWRCTACTELSPFESNRQCRDIPTRICGWFLKCLSADSSRPAENANSGIARSEIHSVRIR